MKQNRDSISIILISRYRCHFSTEAEALNGVLESETTRGIAVPSPAFQSEYAVEVEPNIAFALMLRKRRGEKTQSEIADKLNISYQQYQQLENPKKANPTLRTIAKLQKIFDYKFVSF